MVQTKKDELSTDFQTEKQLPSETGHKTLTILGIIICIVLLPLLIFNISLIVQGIIYPDEVPGIGGYKPMMVLTDSMSPTIKSGDLIIIKEINPTELKVGDIITFFDPAGNGKTTVTHKIQNISTVDGVLMFETQGDNNNAPDRILVEAEAIIGIYLFRIPIVANIIMFMQTVPGLIICIFVPLGALFVYDLIRRLNYDKNHKDDRELLLAELAILKQEKAKNENRDTK